MFMGKITPTKGTFVDIISGVEVHVHSDVVPAGVHFVADQADVAAAGVRQSVDHEFLLQLIRRRLSW